MNGYRSNVDEVSMGNMQIGRQPDGKIPAVADGATGTKGPERAQHPQVIGAKIVTVGKGKLAERISFFHEQIERVTPKANRSISPGPTRAASPQLGQGPSAPSTPSVQKRPLPSPQKAVEETVQEGKKQTVVVHERVASIEAKLVGEEVRTPALPQRPSSSAAIGPRTAELKAKLEEARAKLGTRSPDAPPVLVPAGTTAKELLEAQRKRSAATDAKIGQQKAPEEQHSVTETPALPAEQPASAAIGPRTAELKAKLEEARAKLGTRLPDAPPVLVPAGTTAKELLEAQRKRSAATDAKIGQHRAPEGEPAELPEQLEGSTETATPLPPPPPPPLPPSLPGVAETEEEPSAAAGQESSSIPPPPDSAARTEGPPDSLSKVRGKPLKKVDMEHRSDDSGSSLLSAIQRQSEQLKKASERVLTDKPKGTPEPLNVGEILARRIIPTDNEVHGDAGVEDDASDWGEDDNEIQETALRVSKDISKYETSAERGLEEVRSRKEAFEAARAAIKGLKRPDDNEAQKEIVKQRAAAAAKARDAVKDADEGKIAADKAKVNADAAAAKAKVAAGIADEAFKQPGLQPSARAELVRTAKAAAAAYAVAAKAADTAAGAVTVAASRLKRAGEESERLTALANTPLTSDEIKLAPGMVMRATVDTEFEKAKNALDAAVHLAEEANVAARNASDSLDSVVKGGDATLTQRARDAAEAAKNAADKAQTVVDEMTQALETVNELRQEVTKAVYDERLALIGEEKPTSGSGESLGVVLSDALERRRGSIKKGTDSK